MALIIIYLLLSVISIVIGARAYAIGDKRLQNVQLVISLVAGLCIAIWWIMIDNSTSTGMYRYRINGVEGGGFVRFGGAFAAFLLAAALPNAIGIGIGEARAKSWKTRNRSNSKGGNISLIGKIGCIFCFLIAASCFMVCINDANVRALIPTAIFMAGGIILLIKWKK